MPGTLDLFCCTNLTMLVLSITRKTILAAQAENDRVLVNDVTDIPSPQGISTESRSRLGAVDRAEPMSGKAAEIGSMTTLHDQHGHRKYLTPAERDAFLKAADDAELREVRTFCATLAHTGCRISEALALTADRVDLKDGMIVIAGAKKRKTGIYRPIPVRRHFSTC